MSGRQLSFLAKLLLLFGVYFVTARLGLGLDAVNGFATLVWPPTGIALAAIILLGCRYWPAIAAGAFLINFVSGAPPLVAFGIALGNTLEAVTGAYLLKRFSTFDTSLERLKDVLTFIFFAAILSTTVSTTIGTTSLALGGTITYPHYGETWLAWWVGDMLGALVVTPLILVWSKRLRTPVTLERSLTVLAPFLLLIVASISIFYGLSWLGARALVFAYIVFPFLIWIVLRFGQWGCVNATFIMSLIAIWGTVIARAPDSGVTLAHTLLLLQSFVGSTAITFMIMAAVVSEREETQLREQQLSQRAALLAKQRARLEALNKAKDEFISIASHQLRTPATTVKQYLGMLLEGYVGTLTEQQLLYARIAYTSNEQQLRNINDLLRVATLDAKKVRLQKASCDLSGLIADIVLHQSKEFEQRNQELIFKASKQPIEAQVDQEFLRMVLENIVDNASKYTPPGGRVTIGLQRRKGHVLLQVSDNGIGIAKKDQTKVFQKFTRADSSLMLTVSGTGLGLYWAKKIIDLHGGTISLTSELNKGSTFIIDLPVGAKPSPSQLPGKLSEKSTIPLPLS